MNLQSVNNPTSRIQNSPFVADPQRRQGLLASPAALQTRLPQAVSDYFNGQQPDDLRAVAQWCCDTGEQAVLRNLRAEGFQGLVVVSRLDEVAGCAGECGFELNLLLHGEIDAAKAEELTQFLETYSLNVTGLSLDLSADINYFALSGLIQAVDKLPNLARIVVQVGSQSHAPVAEDVSSVLARSRACLTLSPAIRALILDPEMFRPDKVEAYRAEAQKLEESAVGLNGAAVETLMLVAEEDDDVDRQGANSYAERVEIQAAGFFEEATARRLAPAALTAFLNMERCPETGDPIKGEFADALARLGRDFESYTLLTAIHTLAPDYVMTWREKLPDVMARTLLSTAEIPSKLQHCIVPQLLADGTSFSRALQSFLLAGLDLRVVEDLDERETELLVNAIRQLKKIPEVEFTLAPKVRVDLTFMDGKPLALPNFLTRADALTLNECDGFPQSEETQFFALLTGAFRPKSLSFGSTTPGGAAALLGYIEEPGGLEQLSITCDLPSVPEEPSLVEIITGLLLMKNAFTSIVIRSQELLLPNEREMDEFRRQARKNPSTADIRMEHWSPSMRDWQCYLRENFMLSEMAAAFVSHHLHLPGDVGVHMVGNIGALSARDIPNLAGVSPAMQIALGRFSRKQ